jgi:hypothetical protein
MPHPMQDMLLVPFQVSDSGTKDHAKPYDGSQRRLEARARRPCVPESLFRL